MTDNPYYEYDDDHNNTETLVLIECDLPTGLWMVHLQHHEPDTLGTDAEMVTFGFEASAFDYADTLANKYDCPIMEVYDND